MTKKEEYKVTELEQGVWGISDYRRSSMYLVEGSDRALLIDTGMGTGDLKGFVKAFIGEKMLDVVITHGHWDHTGQANLFDSVYMPEKEEKVIAAFDMDLDTSSFKNVKEGDVFDLGGRKLEVIEVPGHTPGSIVLLDAENRALFSSDAVGTGHLWMHIPGTLTLEQYLENFKKLAERKDEFDKIYPGHIMEVGNKPLDMEYFNNMLYLVEKVLAGEIEGKPYNNEAFPGVFVEKGRAVLVYNPERIR